MTECTEHSIGGAQHDLYPPTRVQRAAVVVGGDPSSLAITTTRSRSVTSSRSRTEPQTAVCPSLRIVTFNERFLSERKVIMGKYRKFSPEYREEAVKMVIESDRPIAAVARDLGINAGTLGNCIAHYREEHPASEELDIADRARLKELEKENRELRMERDFLKKAAAFFAKEQ
jgi:transposase